MKKEEVKRKPDLSIILNIFTLGIFTLVFILKKNYEFLFYTLTLSIAIYILAKSDKIFKYSTLAKYGFTLWLFGHLAGGSFKIAGTRLYDTVLLPLIGEPYNILRYDQVLHFYCYVVIGALVYSIISYYLKETNKKALATITIISAMGIGGINEIIEFATVSFFGATGVGNYINNALDLVFNSLGAILAVFLMRKK
jgi:hypothetical protein